MKSSWITNNTIKAPVMCIVYWWYVCDSYGFMSMNHTYGANVRMKLIFTFIVRKILQINLN